MQPREIRIAISGAAGQIGYALLFRLAAGEMFGPDTVLHLQLLELEQSIPALKGVLMELDDCAFPLIRSVLITSEPTKAFENVDWALLIGSVPRKAGMERKALLTVNGRIFIEQGQALSESAKPTCQVLVVGNPCNTNAYIAKTACKTIPESNFFALTLLDQYRGVAQLSQKAKVNINDVSHLAIWGNHSSTLYPDFYHAKIKGKPAKEVIEDENWLKNDFIKNVQQRGAEIIKVRGLSSAASAANAIVNTVRNLSQSTAEGDFFSVAVSSDGSYGIEQGIMFGFPVQYTGEKWTIVNNIKHSEYSIEKINITYDELLAERDLVCKML